MKWIVAAVIAFGLAAGPARAVVIDVTENSADVSQYYVLGSLYSISYTVDLPSYELAPGQNVEFDITLSSPVAIPRYFDGDDNHQIDYDNNRGTVETAYGPVQTTGAITGATIYFENVPFKTSQSFDTNGPYFLTFAVVPEVRTWALMALGFGFLGGVLRRRHARTGNPNTGDPPTWPAYGAAGRATMIFDVESRVAKDPDAEIRTALSKV